MGLGIQVSLQPAQRPQWTPVLVLRPHLTLSRTSLWACVMFLRGSIYKCDVFRGLAGLQDECYRGEQHEGLSQVLCQTLDIRQTCIGNILLLLNQLHWKSGQLKQLVIESKVDAQQTYVKHASAVCMMYAIIFSVVIYAFIVAQQ